MSLKVAGQVAAEMARRNVRKQDAAAALGLKPPAITRRLKGDVSFSIAELEKIAELLGVRVNDLIPLDD